MCGYELQCQLNQIAEFRNFVEVVPLQMLYESICRRLGSKNFKKKREISEYHKIRYGDGLQSQPNQIAQLRGFVELILRQRLEKSICKNLDSKNCKKQDSQITTKIDRFG